MKFAFANDRLEGNESTEIISEDEQNVQDLAVESNQDDDVETIDRNKAP